MASVLLCTTMGWAFATRLAQAFAACGARVEALAPPGHPLQGCVSRFYPHRAWQGAARWRQVLALSAPDLAVPCDERAVRLLAGLEEAERFLGRRPSYPVLFGRAGFLQAAERLGVKVAPCFAAAREEGLREGLARMGWPALLKTDGSSGGEGVFPVRDEREALRRWRMLRRRALPGWRLMRAVKRRDFSGLREGAGALNVQRFVAGTLAVSAFACWKGEVRAHLAMEVRATQSPLGPATLVTALSSPQMERTARAIAAGFGLSGLHGLDFIIDEAGEPWLIEINPRATPICHLALGEGRDLPAALLATVDGREAQWRPALAQTATIAL